MVFSAAKYSRQMSVVTDSSPKPLQTTPKHSHALKYPGLLEVEAPASAVPCEVVTVEMAPLYRKQASIQVQGRLPLGVPETRRSWPPVPLLLAHLVGPPSPEGGGPTREGEGEDPFAPDKRLRDSRYSRS